ncbi:MAG: hypothetical protein Kow00121_21890 [Elainellaceae cyanobacterium]
MRPSLTSSNLAQTSESALSIAFAAPRPPGGIGSPGRRIGGGRRGPDPVIGTANENLTALVPVYGAAEAELVFSKTAADYPTFWFYVPVAEAATGNFVLQDQAGNPIYETDIVLPERSGIISVSLPSTVASLEVGQRYQWYLKVYYQPEPPPAYVHGWIQRDMLSPDLMTQLEQATVPEQVRLYAAHGFWHEALTLSAELRQTNANDSAWADLLQSVNLGYLDAASMVQ